MDGAGKEIPAAASVTGSGNDPLRFFDGPVGGEGQKIDRNFE
jgi:hypothetical protein